MMMAAIAPLAAGDPLRYATLAAASALITGLICLAAGLMRIGFIANFISQPILTGYMAGVSLMVIGGQLGRLVGMKVEADEFFPQVWEVLTRWDEIQWVTLASGIVMIVVLFWLKRRWPRVPGPLIVMAVMILLSTLLDLAARASPWSAPSRPACRRSRFPPSAWKIS